MLRTEDGSLTELREGDEVILTERLGGTPLERVTLAFDRPCGEGKGKLVPLAASATDGTGSVDSGYGDLLVTRMIVTIAIQAVTGLELRLAEESRTRDGERYVRYVLGKLSR